MKLTEFMEQTAPKMVNHALTLEYSVLQKMWLTTIPRASWSDGKRIVGKGRTTGESMDDFCKIVRGQEITLDYSYKDRYIVKVPNNLTV